MIPPRPIYFLWSCCLFLLSSSSPLATFGDNTTAVVQPIIIEPRPLPGESRQGTGIMMSWIWGLVWGDDSTVTVVDRTPALNFNARPAAFGPSNDVLGYMIRVEDFSIPCDDDPGNGVDDREDPPWWPGGGSEWENQLDLTDESDSEGGWHGQGSTPEREWSVEARHGCPRLCVRDKHKPESSETWIALVMRGGCTFVEKVREAQRFGAKGVVVGGETKEQDEHGDGLVQMYSLGDSSDIKIPSTYVTHDSYRKLSALIESSNTSTWGLRTVSVGITSDPSGWEWYSPVLTFLILLFLPSSLTLCTLLIHRFRAARAAQRERAPEDIVLNLPWRVWEGPQTVWELEKTLDPVKGVSSSGGARTLSQVVNDTEMPELVQRPDGTDPESHTITNPQSEPSTSRPHSLIITQPPTLGDPTRKWYETQVECAICLEEFVKGDKVRVLPCRHIFHMDEVDDWLIRRKKLCPICKHDVTRPLLDVSTQSPSSTNSPERAHPHGHESRERASLSTIYEEDAELNDRTPLLSQSRTSSVS